MTTNCSIHCRAQILTPTKGAMIELVATTRHATFTRHFPLADINASPIIVYRWLGECGIVATSEVKKLVLQALSDIPRAREGWVAEAPGWYGKAFVTPAETIGADTTRIINLATLSTSRHKWQRAGTLEDWCSKIASPLAGSPVAVFSFCSAFAGPVLALTEITTLVFMIVGPSSVGKTTLLELCGSVWGGGEQGFTDTFLKSPEEFEVAAQCHRDGWVGLDETQLLGSNSHDAAQKFKKVLFRYASETPKKIFDRPSSEHALRGVRFFTSNLSAAAILRGAGLSFDSPEAVRVLEIPVDRSSFPVFDLGEDTAKAAERVQRLKKRSRRLYGTAGRKFLQCLVADRTKDESALRLRITRYIEEGMDVIRPSAQASNIDTRMARQMSVVYAAGRLASWYGVLPYKRRVLSRSLTAVWAKAHQHAIESLRRNPVTEFLQNLEAGFSKLTDLDAGLPTLKKSEAKDLPGFKKTMKDGRLAIYLSGRALARLTPFDGMVLRWLEANAFLLRDNRGNSKKKGKRQVKTVVGHDPDENPIRLRVYKILGGITDLARAPGQQASKAVAAE